MSGAGRFKRTAQLERRGRIITSRGVDTTTGAAVLIYDFPGPPRLKRNQFASSGALTVLAAGFDGVNGVLVAALPPNANPLNGSGARIDDRLALQALAVLKDAGTIGLVHGAITPGRLLLKESSLYIEGYGVPWNPQDLVPLTRGALERAAANDLKAILTTLLTAANARLNPEVAAALTGALRALTGMKEGRPPPLDAAHLHAVVRRLVGGAVSLPPADFAAFELTEKPLSTPQANAELDELHVALFEEPEPSQQTDPALTPTNAPPTGSPALFAAEGEPVSVSDPDPITLTSDPGDALRVAAEYRDSSPGFVKRPPPGATYRAGNLEHETRVSPLPILLEDEQPERRRSWRVPLFLLALLAAAGVGAYIALVVRPGAPVELSGSTAASYVVNVRVTPPGLPPVSLVVDRSPAASAFRPGTIIATVPRNVSFDAPGEYTLHAVYLGQASRSVTLEVPADSAVTIEFPLEAPR